MSMQFVRYVIMGDRLAGEGVLNSRRGMVKGEPLSRSGDSPPPPPRRRPKRPTSGREKKLMSQRWVHHEDKKVRPSFNNVGDHPIPIRRGRTQPRLARIEIATV